MKIGLQTWGSDGDIRPFFALASGLRQAGHEVELCLFSVDGKDYAPLAQQLGIHLISIAHQANLHLIAEKMAATTNPLHRVRLLFDAAFLPWMDAMFVAAQQLCQHNDLVIGHYILNSLKAAAEQSGTPHVSIFLCPTMLPTRQHVPMPLSDSWPWLHGLLWRVVNIGINRELKTAINDLRKRHGIAPIRSVLYDWQSNGLNLVASSEALFPAPQDWSSNIKVCGFFDVPKSAEPWPVIPELAQFLAAGEAPVYLTFGSMTQFLLQESTQLMLQAAERSGRRAIVQSTWSELTDLPPTQPHIFRIGKVPHQHIFPHCAAVVHHGGAGTTQVTSRAGIPSVVVAHAFDQNFWGRQLQRYGAAGPWLNRRHVTAELLATEIRRVCDSADIRLKAQQLGTAMQSEDGVANAVAAIENYMV